MSRGVSPALLGRIAALAVVVVFFQIGVVSEVPVFGVSVDLSPLLVAFVGLLCGSMVGAVSGFAVGLLVDLALTAPTIEPHSRPTKATNRGERSTLTPNTGPSETTPI